MKKKLFMTYMVLMVVGFVLIGVLTHQFLKDNYEEDLTLHLASNLKLLKLNVEKKLFEEELEGIDFHSFVSEISETIDVRVTVIDSKGKVLADSEVLENDLFDMENHQNRSEFKEALDGFVGKGIRTSATVNIDYMYMAIPLEKDGEIVGAVRLAYPLVRINQINRNFIENILLSLFIAFGISLFMAYRYSKRITEPILSIAESAKQISTGDFEHKVNVKTGDEIEALGDAFNVMTERLKNNISMLNDEHLNLQSILTSISEGLVAVDNEKRVMLMNYSCKEILGVDDRDVYGKILTDIIEEPAARDMVSSILENEEIGSREVVIREPEHMVLKISSGKIRLDTVKREILGTIMVIRDITEIRVLEDMRKDFVANVSHELKTPLTSISGFVETLKGGAMYDENVRDRFLDIIEIESARLYRLIDDLLILSNIETSQLGKNRKDAIDMGKAIEEVCEMVDITAENKGIKIKRRIPEDLPSLYGNRDWFKQMVLNLVDNAVKYTSDGGEVFVSVYKFDRDLFIKVKDTGLGIPENDIPRIFERFYRVDKARSRDVGGTGLGLAIVKHIVIAFNGEIKARSEEGKGSEFIVKIPLNENVQNIPR
ncbi:MAG: HAMP domain-containing protein [Peptostreptococcaceae bacterium]|nr:HAMP domain-containing protein [Peptostreptococcaceae bacterium]